jgi:hypothetical protein
VRSRSASEKSSSAWRAGVFSLVPSPFGDMMPSAYALCVNDEAFADSASSVSGASAKRLFDVRCTQDPIRSVRISIRRQGSGGCA